MGHGFVVWASRMVPGFSKGEAGWFGQWDPPSLRQHVLSAGPDLELRPGPG